MKFWSPKTFPGVMKGPAKNFGPIGSAVLAFIGYKRKDNSIVGCTIGVHDQDESMWQPDKKSIYIEDYNLV